MPVVRVKIDLSSVIEAARSEHHRALSEATVRVARTPRMPAARAGQLLA